MRSPVSPKDSHSETDSAEEAVSAITYAAKLSSGGCFFLAIETVEHACDSPIELPGLQQEKRHRRPAGQKPMRDAPANFRQVANYFPFPQPALRGEMVHFVTPPHLTLSEG
jgi:hypothetical protein